jgi:hypothetical protein
MLSLLASTPSFTAAGRFGAVAIPSPRFAAPHMAAAWSAVNDGAPRDANLVALNELADAGDATIWNSMKLSARPVTLGELSRTTKIDEKALDPTATEFSIGDIQDVFIKVIIGCTVLSILVAVVGDALNLDAGFRFTATYLIAGIPIGILAIGSTAPGILFLPVEAFRKMTASEEQKATGRERVCKHEASHLLCAYALGLPIKEVAVDPSGSGPRVVVYDEELATAPGQLVKGSQIDALAVVAVSGLIAEAAAYGKALGATEDLKLLNSILLRCSPPIPAQKQQDTTRYAALMAWSILQKHEAAYKAICGALEQGKGLSACLEAAEEAEKGQEAAAKVAAQAKADAIAKETPQEKAAREREEMAARGKF